MIVSFFYFPFSDVPQNRIVSLAMVNIFVLLE